MPKSVNRLAPRKIPSYPPGRHSDGGNLYLQVADSGSRSWVFMYRRQGKQRELGLGSARDVTLAQARSIATNHRVRLAQGFEPDRKRNKRNDGKPTFGQIAAAVIEDLRPGWRNAEHGRQWAVTIQQHAGALTSIPIDQINVEHVLSVLRPIWQSTRETADRLRGRIERVLDYARAKGLRSGENPARWRGHLDQLLPGRQRIAQKHHPALDYGKMPTFMAELRKRRGVTPLALEFTILTAARCGEVLGATWDEIDWERAVWTVPGSRMKSGKEHIVPLSEAALTALRQLLPPDVRTDPRLARPNPASPSRAMPYPAETGYVFPGSKRNKPLSDGMPLQLAKEIDPTVTAHGMRSSFRDWAGDCTAASRETAEGALAHAIGGVEGAYRRGTGLERRRQLMDAWASYCNVVGSSDHVVVPLRALG